MCDTSVKYAVALTWNSGLKNPRLTLSLSLVCLLKPDDYYPPNPQSFMPDMTAVEETIRLVKTIHTLSQALPPSVPKATTGDKIWDVMHGAESESAFQTFNQRFDALFAEDCRDAEGRLHYIRQGKSGPCVGVFGLGLPCSNGIICF